MQGQVDIFNFLFIRQVFQPEQLIADLAGTGAVLIDDIAANHVSDQFIFAGILDLQSGDIATVTHNGNGITDLENFLQAVGNINNGYTFIVQGAHDFKQNLGFLLSQRGSGFVQNQNLCVLLNCTQNLNQLLTAHT